MQSGNIEIQPPALSEDEQRLLTDHLQRSSEHFIHILKKQKEADNEQIKWLSDYKAISYENGSQLSHLLSRIGVFSVTGTIAFFTPTFLFALYELVTYFVFMILNDQLDGWVKQHCNVKWVDDDHALYVIYKVMTGLSVAFSVLMIVMFALFICFVYGKLKILQHLISIAEDDKSSDMSRIISSIPMVEERSLSNKRSLMILNENIELFVACPTTAVDQQP